MIDNTPHRELLVALLAIQHEWVSADQVIQIVSNHKSNSREIGQYLLRHELLTAEEYHTLRQMADIYLSRHNNDTVAALTAIGSSDIPWQKLMPFVDGELSQAIKSIASRKWDRTIDYDSIPSHPPSADRLPNDSSRMGNRFTILRFHRKGGLGFVSLAEDQELHRRVAVKQIREEHADHPEQQAKFLLEAEITGGLEHPNIVPVYGLGRDTQGHPYYAMKFIQGDSLKDAIRNFHRIPRTKTNQGMIQVRLRQLLQHFIDVCHAMHYAHNRGVLHRDLKPSNIMLGKYGETLVVDWGLARPRSSEPEPEFHGNEEPPLDPPSASETLPDPAGVAIGTPRYMAPEQAAGQIDQFGRWTDVYSLGATLYTLLTDKLPFPGYDVTEILRDVRLGQFQPPAATAPNVPAPLNAICLKAMSLCPADRYQTARHLADDIERWMADEPVTAWTEPWHVRAGRWVRKHQTLVTSTVATLTVALGLSILAAALLNRAWQRAEANFQVAKNAVDQYFTEVSESVLLNQAGMQPLRRQLLSHAKVFYEDFLRSRGHDASIQVESARTHFRLGRIDEMSSRHANALKSYERAIQQQQRNLESAPDSPESIADLALTWNAIGRIRNELGEHEAAQKAFDTSRQLRQTLVTLAPHNLEYQRWLANSLMNLGELALSAAKRTDAEPLLRQSQTIRTRALESNSSRDAEPLKLDLAKGFYNLGRLALLDSQPEEARSNFQLAVEHCQQLLNNHPGQLEYVELLANSQRMLADSYMHLNDEIMAAGIYRETLPTLRMLAYGNPDEVKHAFRLAGVCINLALAMEHNAVAPRAGSYESVAYYWAYAEELLAPFQARLNEFPEFRRDYAIVACRRAFQLANTDQEGALVVARRAAREFTELELAERIDADTRRMWISTLQLIGRVSSDRDNGREAISAYETAIRLQRSDPNATSAPDLTLAKLLLELGQRHLQAGNVQAALAVLQDANMTCGDPSNIDAASDEMLATHSDVLRVLGVNGSQLGIDAEAQRQYLTAAEAMLVRLLDHHPMHAKLSQYLADVRRVLETLNTKP